MKSSLMIDPRGKALALSEMYEQFQSALQTSVPSDIVRFPRIEHEDELLRVLIVDDYRSFTDTLSNLVARWGHDCRRAYDAVTGLALAAAFQPDVLLLDISMPEMSGVELVLQVRRQNRLKHCFIMTLTGCTDLNQSRRYYDAGIDLFLTKPIRPSDVETLLMLEAEHVREVKAWSTACTERRPTTTS
jgi:DNA-binding response OmpR family regulator